MVLSHTIRMLRATLTPLVSSALAMLLVLGLVVTTTGDARPGPAPRAAAATTAATGAVLAARAKAPDSYTPPRGVKFNNPRSNEKRRVILRHILRTIRSTPRHEAIRIMSWNVASRAFVDALMKAHNRGVSVRLLMSKGKADDQPRSTGDFWRLKRHLSKPSERFPEPRMGKSWARTCAGSCRGSRGTAHIKSYVFSRAGDANKVVMLSSANATEVSANYQWNDIYTLVGNTKIYEKYLDIFRESQRDERARPPYQTVNAGSVHGYWFPWAGGAAKGDRVLNELNKIKCRGAKGGTGINGRTKIRIGMDAWIDKRGVEIAKKMRRLYDQGCNIKVVDALLGSHALKILRRGSRPGSVPVQQIVQDFDNDGIYDRYLHAKVMTVSGVYDGDPSARVVWNGTENWSGLAKLSDEAGFRLMRGSAERKYSRWIDNLFANPPPRNRRREAAARSAGIDPYANMEHN